MAGFRIGRGRAAQQPPQRAPRPQPGGAPQWQQPPAQPPTGRPEYFGEPTSYGRTRDDAPGHTQSFAVNGEDPYGGYGNGPYGGGQYGSYGDETYADNGPYADTGYADGPYAGGPYGGAPGEGGNPATYRAGTPSGPPSGPRLHWRDLLSGIVMRPGRTFWQMRDYQVWGPALLVTFVYGLIAVFGFDSARQDILSSSTSQSVPWVLCTAVAVVVSGLMMGAVTHTLARQFGGDGGWAPTIGLSMLITSLTDAPRLLFAVFLGGANGFVQVLGWLTWLACAALLTSMVSKSHDLPWPKALGAASIQLVALLVLFKLPTL
ncbi:YIP1 family protein [Streptomyces sp. PTM05]|uniref:YIP1 family protein n=1 Tax=Streptantibioticus parmotrematis TaxID=2873249 RepID=A0ABS7QV66_9ACTN|nr:Yip1 family protein [Streptantibioticus parmotrematis]MBY8886606.1 YIP1 family protein [Streptantibioticus parmotrematis]